MFPVAHPIHGHGCCDTPQAADDSLHCTPSSHSHQPLRPPPRLVPAHFLANFAYLLILMAGCSGSLANLTYDPNVVLFANPIVGTGSSCLPYARFISQNQTIYFSAKACGPALEIGLFNNSPCMMSASYSHLYVDRMPSMLPLSTPAKPFLPQFSGIYSSNCLFLMILRTRAV
jgi:hypothetical protein